jgi:flavoprotein
MAGISFKQWLIDGVLTVIKELHNPDNELEYCLLCGKDFVNPVEYEEVTPESWWMLLRCGECHTFREVTVTNAIAERFDLELDRREDILKRTLHKLDTERMHAQAEAMIGALLRNLIDAADFT